MVAEENILDADPEYLEYTRGARHRTVFSAVADYGTYLTSSLRRTAYIGPLIANPLNINRIIYESRQ